MLALPSTTGNDQRPDGVRAPRYYSLKCLTCELLFPRVVATSKEEILEPDFECMAEQAGEFNAERFEAFFGQHLHHVFDAVEI